MKVEDTPSLPASLWQDQLSTWLGRDPSRLSGRPPGTDDPPDGDAALATATAPPPPRPRVFPGL